MRIRKLSKLMLLSFTLLYSIVMILGSTFSWMTSSDSVKNELKSNSLHVILQEVFTPNLKWAAGSTSQKIVTVKNVGMVPTVVRVRLTENFLGFQFDNNDQNGKLRTVNTALSNPIKCDDTNTWVQNRTYTENGINYVGGKALLNCDVMDSERNSTPLQYIHINQPDVMTIVNPSASNYWIYDSGYFYYSEILKPGESSTPLVTSLKTAEKLPHSYQFALYKMDVSMQALGAANGALTMWSDLPAGSVHAMLNNKLAGY